jgi:hypothetical protein
MVKCTSKNGVEVWVSRCYDCEPNLGGFFCQVYLDEDCEYEIDNFVVPAAVVDANVDERFIVAYINATDYYFK